MRLVSTPPNGVHETRLGRRMERYVRYAVRLALGLLLGAVLGSHIQRGLASVSIAFLVPLALASVALALFTLAIFRTVRDLRRAHRVLRQD